MVQRVWSAISLLSIFTIAGIVSFVVGLHSVNNIGTMTHTIDAQAQSSQVNVILQYLPVGGSIPVPIEVSQVINASQSSLVHLIEVHTGDEEPSTPQSRCRTTNSLGRCNIAGVPVGGDPEMQYDIVVDIDFIEFLTQIPLVRSNAYVRFDRSECAKSVTSFSGNIWCMTRPGGQYASEYFVTITLQERDRCREFGPPASFCDVNRKLVSYRCNPAHSGPTNPYEPVPTQCDAVQCPDGNFVSGVCSEVVPDVPACNTAASCRDNQLCSVRNVASLLPYTAGRDSIILRGDDFGTQGGVVTFPTRNGGSESVNVYAGQDWSNTQIRVAVPAAAVSGILRIHPHSHGAFGEGNDLQPATCTSPSVTVRGFNDQFSLLSVTASSPDGVQLVSPGYETLFTLNVRHNERVSRLDTVEVQLLAGSHTDPDNLPVQRNIITQTECPVSFVGSPSSREAVIGCSLTVPQSAEVYDGPFTFVVILYDDLGESDTAVLTDAGRSSLAGDMTLDGLVTIQDAAFALRMVRGVIVPTGDQLLRDPNNDGRITMEDVLFILHSLSES